jgi:hypothetical protein
LGEDVGRGRGVAVFHPTATEINIAALANPPLSDESGIDLLL